MRHANGELLSRTLRTYDAQGRIIEEKQIMEKPELGFPLEDSSKTPEESGLSADQRRQALREAILKFMGGLEWYSFSNRYDTRGRLSHTSARALRYKGEIEITYNERGDRESAIGQGLQSDRNNAAPSPSYSETRYSYKYDQHDNWIEKVESQRSSPDGPGFPRHGGRCGQGGWENYRRQLPHLSGFDPRNILDDGSVLPVWGSNRLDQLPKWLRVAGLVAPVLPSGVV